MTEHLTQQQIEDYRARKLAPDQFLHVADHIATCAACRAQVARPEASASVLQQMEKDLKASQEDEQNHLSYEEMAAYVNGAGDSADREIVETHLAWCDPCAQEVRELRAFRAALSTYPQEPAAPAPAPSLRWRLSGLLPSPGWRFALQTGGAMAAGILLALLFLRGRPAGRAVQPPSPKLAADAQRWAKQAAEASRQAALAQQQYRLAQGELARSQATLKQAQADLKALRAVRNRPTPPPQLAVPVFAPGQLLPGRRGERLLAVRIDPDISHDLSRGRLSLPVRQVAALNPSSVQMGVTEPGRSFRLLQPYATFVRTLHPTLSWKPVPGALKYEAQVIERASDTPIVTATIERAPDGGWRVTTSSQAPAGQEQSTPPQLSHSKQMQWTLPASCALQPGKVYRWTVTATLKNGKTITSPSEGDALFQTLDAQSMQAIEQQAKLYESSPLLLGILYARYGLLDDADQSFSRWIESHPADASAQSFQHQLHALRQSHAIR